MRAFFVIKLADTCPLLPIWMTSRLHRKWQSWLFEGLIERIYIRLHCFYRAFTPACTIGAYIGQTNQVFMKHLKRVFTMLLLLAVIIGSPAFAQDYFSSNPRFSLNARSRSVRAREVLQDNEYTSTGFEEGTFYDNPLMLDGMSLDYTAFNLKSTGELRVVKGAATTGQTTLVPFFVYLRRAGKIVLIPGKESPDINQVKVDLSEILQHAQPWDQLVIEPVRKEDGPAKRILNLLGDGC